MRAWVASALSLPLIFASPSWVQASVSSNTGYSYTFTANGVPNTVNWNNNGFSNFAITDGRLVTPSAAIDAYDNGAQIEVCATSGCAYNASMVTYTATGTAASSTLYQGASQTFTGGLNLTASYKFSETSASMRMLVQLDNTSASPITRTIRFVNWLGCDTACYLRYHSLAGATQGSYFAASATPFTTSSYWSITSDAAISDAITSFAYGGPGGASAPSTTFTNGQDANTFTNIEATIPANSTRYLVFLAGLGGVTNTKNTLLDAYSGVSTTFDTWSHIPADIKSDLTSTQLSQILNWNTTPPTSSVSLSLAGASTTAVKGNSILITAAVTQAGLVNFYWNNKKISGCINKLAATSVSCNWKPSVTGAWNLKATLKPTDTSFGLSSSSNFQVLVGSRIVKR
jgi:hypothetical protein